MSKFTIDQMLSIVSNKLDGVNPSEIGEQIGVSVKRIDKFLSASEGDVNTHPLYMLEFWKQYALCCGDAESIKNALTPLKAEKVRASDLDLPLTGGAMAPKAKQRESLAGRNFVFTSAQNNTEVHTDFLKSLQVYCAEKDAQLVIGQFVYNKNGFQNGVVDGDDIYFAKELQPYFVADSRQVADDLVWCGELNILPTTKYPLSGLQQYTGAACSIVPASTIGLESVATQKALPAKIMYSTGCITQHNYIQKKTGQLAESRHNYGALVVEFDKDDKWFARQIETDESGCFYDLLNYYTPKGVESGAIEAINWGDLHAEKSDSDVLESCIDMLDALNPNYQLFHDTFDMTGRNHHNRDNAHFLAEMFYNDSESVEKDIKTASSVLEMFSSETTHSVVVESNHDLALTSWLVDNRYDFKKDPVNSMVYLELQLAQYKAIKEKRGAFNLLEFALQRFGGGLGNISFLNTDDSFAVAGVEMGMHGHVGANGSRGTPKQFQNLNCAVNTGHTHSASIYGNVYTAGVTGALDMGYNIGASSWSHSHILTYPNGKRAIVTMKPDQLSSWNWKA